MQEAVVMLKQKEVFGAYSRPSSIDIDESIVVLKDMQAVSLVSALNTVFARLTQRASTPKQRKIVLDRFTVADKMEHIRNTIKMQTHCCFDQLFDDDYTKSEVITTFQALLELLKFQEVTVQQDDIFGKIEIFIKECERDLCIEV